MEIDFSKISTLEKSKWCCWARQAGICIYNNLYSPNNTYAAIVATTQVVSVSVVFQRSECVYWKCKTISTVPGLIWLHCLHESSEPFYWWKIAQHSEVFAVVRGPSAQLAIQLLCEVCQSFSVMCCLSVCHSFSLTVCTDNAVFCVPDIDWPCCAVILWCRSMLLIVCRASYMLRAYTSVSQSVGVIHVQLALAVLTREYSGCYDPRPLCPV